MSKDGYIKVSISGDLGSGKSTICRLMQARHPFRIYSMGEAWRRLAEKYNMTILELNRYSETHPLDEEMDRSMAEEANTEEDIIFDARLGWYFVPGSFKVHLIVETDIAAQRIYNDRRGKSEGYSSVGEAKDSILRRKASESDRYMQKYGIDCGNMDNYDLVIDTSYTPPESITELIFDKLELWKEGKTFDRIWLSPKSLFPSTDPDRFSGRITVIDDDSFPTGDGETDLFVPGLKVNGKYYVIEDNRTVSGAAEKGIALLPVRIIARDGDRLPRGITAREYVEQF